MLDNTSFGSISSENILELDSLSSERNYSELTTGGNPIGMSFDPLKSNLSAEGLESGPTVNESLNAAPNTVTGNFTVMEKLSDSEPGMDGSLMRSRVETNVILDSNVIQIEGRNVEANNVHADTCNMEDEALGALASLDKELYVTKFGNHTTCDDIKRYISSKGDYDLSQMKIIQLVKKGQDVSVLTFVSFKIETCKEIAEQLLTPKFWPKGSYAKEFIRKMSSAAQFDLASISDDFLAKVRTASTET